MKLALENGSVDMKQATNSSWERFKEFYRDFPEIELAVDLSRMSVTEGFFNKMEKRIQKAFRDMDALEHGDIANPDEKRMVGHYWLRNPAIAPTAEIRRTIETTVAKIEAFARQVHAGKIRGQRGRFRNLLLIGIGGSALGPQFVSHALGHPLRDKVRPFFFDNTDPDGMSRVLDSLGKDLGRTICVVISKSGGTKETRNGMLEAKAAYERRGLRFEKHAVAVTGVGSELDKFAKLHGWIDRFPMWDWVGGRTSEMSAVGLLPAALQGIDIGQLLAGAKACDELTRGKQTRMNPSALLALAWFSAGEGKGDKNMVVIPYKDRLELLSRYLQQLIMESLGKEHDLAGRRVNQGITVFGNKGATDQHSYIQQLRDGLSDFFLTLVEVKRDHDRKPVFVEESFTSGDFLSGFLLGTREALSQGGRETLTLTIKEVSPFSVGVIIALFERAVGLYASLVNINAYHQPGVEAGKKAAAAVLKLQQQIVEVLERSKTPMTVETLAKALKSEESTELVFKICERLSANQFSCVSKSPGRRPFESRYCVRA
jgi:glucose-6-phosphate isomerase